MNTLKLIEKLARELPTFADGRIDYTEAKKAPVINCAVYADGQLLVLKRSQQVIAHAGRWNGVSGFIDTYLPIMEIAQNELSEELTLTVPETQITVLDPHEYEDHEFNRTWVVFPVGVSLHDKPDIYLDDEHTDFAWIDPKKLGDYDCIPDFKRVVERTASAV